MTINKQLRVEVLVSYDANSFEYTATTTLYTGSSKALVPFTVQISENSFDDLTDLTQRLMNDVHDVISQYTPTNKNRIDVLSIQTNFNKLLKQFSEVTDVFNKAKVMRRNNRDYTPFIETKLGNGTVAANTCKVLLDLHEQVRIARLQLTQISNVSDVEIVNETKTQRKSVKKNNTRSSVEIVLDAVRNRRQQMEAPVPEVIQQEVVHEEIEEPQLGPEINAMYQDLTIRKHAKQAAMFIRANSTADVADEMIELNKAVASYVHKSAKPLTDTTDLIINQLIAKATFDSSVAKRRLRQ